MFSVWMGESHAHLANLTYMLSKSACGEHNLIPRVLSTFDYPQLLRWELGIWNGSWERPGYHSSCISRRGGVITKDGSHIVSIEICGYLINTCAKWCDNWKQQGICGLSSFSGFFPTRESIHSNLVSHLLCQEV